MAPRTTPNEPYWRVIGTTYQAQWRTVDVHASDDRTASPFGPKTALASGERAPLGGFGTPKDVLYVPARKTAGKQYVPSLAIRVKLLETQVHGRSVVNVDVHGRAGHAVHIQVSNVWKGGRRPTVSLEGKLDEDGVCVVHVPASRVAEWLDPTGPFEAQVNEILLDFSFRIPSLQVDGAPIAGQSRNRVFIYRRKVIVFLPGVFGSQVQITLPDGREMGFPDYMDENVPPILSLIHI